MRTIGLPVRGVRMAMLAMLTLGLATRCQTVAAAEVVTCEITADEMCCGGCAKKVAGQLYTAPGVTNVTANVAARTVVVTAQPNPKLTLEKLWNAVEKGNGKPSRLVFSGYVYNLKRTPDLSPDQQPTPGVYTLVIAELQAGESADRIAKVLYGIRGVSKISIDAPNSALIVEPAADVALSPWLLMTAVQQAKSQPVEITGPFGRFTIEADETTQVSARPSQQGASR